MNIEAVLPSVATKCPKCSSTHLRRSSWHKGDGRLLTLLFSPYRCVACDKRFFKVSRRFESMLLAGSIALLLMASISGIVYFINLDAPAPAPAARRPFATTSANAANTSGGGSVPVADIPQLKTAEKGDVQAQFELGMLYLMGDGGVPKNYALALKWLEAAANQKHAEARYNLGVMYRAGQGALQNFETAFRWFELAAMQSHVEAQYNVGLMYKTGMSVPIDPIQAYMWVNLAASHGHLGAMTLRDQLLHSMTPQQVAEGQRASRDWKPAGTAENKSAENATPAALPSSK